MKIETIFGNLFERRNEDMKRYLRQIAFLVALAMGFIGNISVLAADALSKDALLSKPHHTSWAYFQDSSGIWYITNSSGNVYFLTPMKNGAGWGTIGNSIANLDFDNNRVTINNGITNGMSTTSYYDIGWGENVSGTVTVGDRTINGNRAYQLAQGISGKTLEVKWYFFKNENTGRWYITNLSTNLYVYLFASKEDSSGGYYVYDWQLVDTDGISNDFFWDNSKRYVDFSSLDTSIAPVCNSNTRDIIGDFIGFCRSLHDSIYGRPYRVTKISDNDVYTIEINTDFGATIIPKTYGKRVYKGNNCEGKPYYGFGENEVEQFVDDYDEIKNRASVVISGSFHDDSGVPSFPLMSRGEILTYGSDMCDSGGGYPLKMLIINETAQRVFIKKLT